MWKNAPSGCKLCRRGYWEFFGRIRGKSCPFWKNSCFLMGEKDGHARIFGEYTQNTAGMISCCREILVRAKLHKGILMSGRSLCRER